MTKEDVNAYGEYVNRFGLPLVIIAGMGWFVLKYAWPAFLSRVAKYDQELDDARKAVAEQARLCSESHEKIAASSLEKQEKSQDRFHLLTDKLLENNRALTVAVERIADKLDARTPR